MAETKKKIQKYVYLGPVLKKGQYRSGKICIGLPSNLESEFKEQPALKMLFVKVEKLMKAKAEVKKQGTALNVIYKEIEKWLEGGNK